MYTEKQLVSFANYLLAKNNVLSPVEDNDTIRTQVTDADLSNWKLLDAE